MSLETEMLNEVIRPGEAEDSIQRHQQSLRGMTDTAVPITRIIDPLGEKHMQSPLPITPEQNA